MVSELCFSPLPSLPFLTSLSKTVADNESGSSGDRTQSPLWATPPPTGVGGECIKFLPTWSPGGAYLPGPWAPARFLSTSSSTSSSFPLGPHSSLLHSYFIFLICGLLCLFFFSQRCSARHSLPQGALREMGLTPLRNLLSCGTYEQTRTKFVTKQCVHKRVATACFHTRKSSVCLPP